VGRSFAGLLTACACCAGFCASSCESKPVEIVDRAHAQAEASCEPPSSDFQAPTVIVAEGNSNPSALYVDDEYVYWSSTADNLSLRRARKNGCENTMLAHWQGGSQPFASDAEYVYWLATPGSLPGGQSVVHSLDRKTGATRDFPLAASYLWGGLVTSAGSVVVYDLECLSVGQLKATDGSAQNFSLVPPATPGAGGETVVVSDETQLFCSSANRIYMVSKSSTPWHAEVLHTSDNAIRGMTADASSLYWVEHGPAPAQFRPPEQWPQTIYKLAKTGGAPTRLAGLDQAGFGGAMVFDGVRQTLYWIRQNSAHSDLLALPLGSTEVRYIARGRNLRGALAQDAQYLYFTEDHAITKLKKPVLSP
jgi:hypothetical protein